MVYEISSVEIAPGKYEEAQEWAKEILDYSIKRWGVTGYAVTPVTPGPGQGGRIAWIIAHDSLAQWGKVHDQTVDDAEWQEFGKTYRVLNGNETGEIFK